jgi:sterol desaturase/sphingolipid hydroxylase (fatty acid hydroxylase superfamily)
MFRRITMYAFYPVLLTAIILVIVGAIHYHWDYKLTYALTTLGLILLLMFFEFTFPLSPEWKMTGKIFLRDLKYIIVDAPLIALTKSIFGLFAIYYSENHKGFFSNSPVIISVLGFLLVYEFFQYWYHHLSHTGKGKWGKFLWGAHLAHHLPDKVYVVMHAVFNPINAIITAIIIQTPLVLLGISPEAALAATLIIDLQSMISHFNADIRAGYLNFIFIGAETHRYHHSANMEESKNYGNTLAIWDIVFGTFLYKPGNPPEKLGIEGQEDYPPSNNIFQVILYPFKKNIDHSLDKSF